MAIRPWWRPSAPPLLLWAGVGLVAWSALYYGINYYLLLEEQSDRLARLENQAASAQLGRARHG